MNKALVVGINYVGTPYELRGCVNDATSISSMLKERGFLVETLLDSAATTSEIKSALSRLTDGVVPGDVIVFHYSGHGSQLPSATEPDGFEEIICPIDLDWKTRVITDDDLRSIFSKVKIGVNVTVILDCCHSGDAIDSNESYIPLRELVHLDETSSPDARRFLTPPPEVKLELQDRELVRWKASRDLNGGALLVAACRSHQTAADAFIDGMYQGAGTASILAALRANENITYKQLVDQMTDFMISHGFSQRPQLDGHSVLFSEKFLGGYCTPTKPAAAALAELLKPEPAPVVIPTEPVQVPSETTNNLIWLLIGVTITCALALLL